MYHTCAGNSGKVGLLHLDLDLKHWCDEGAKRYTLLARVRVRCDRLKAEVVARLAVLSFMVNVLLLCVM